MLLTQALPNNDFRESKDASWLLLESAQLALETGATEQSVARFRQAIESMDYYNQDVWTEQASALLTADEAIAYQTPPFESVLARVYFALALYQQGDRSNAHAILRQAEQTQQLLQESGIAFTPNPLAKGLLGLASLETGDASNARILFKQAAEISGNTWEAAPDEAWLLVLVHAGNAPIKISTFAPAATASAAAVQTMLPEDVDTPPLTALPVIALPELKRCSATPPTLSCQLAEQDQPLAPSYDIACAASIELERTLPLIAARAVGRHLLRRTAVIAANEADEDLGSFADLALLVANAATRADVRSWSALPERIDSALFSTAPGLYPLRILSSNGVPLAESEIFLVPGKLTIAQLFVSEGGVSPLLVSPN